jgi:predicted Zn-dependent protease with MMP-like domain
MVSRWRFEQLVAEALDELPAWVHERLENVEVIVEEEPPDSEWVLGLYEGIPLTQRGAGYTWTMPDRITLFQGPIERAAGTPRAIKEAVSETVIHEVAHFFGISDRRLRELGRD